MLNMMLVPALPAPSKLRSFRKAGARLLLDALSAREALRRRSRAIPLALALSRCFALVFIGFVCRRLGIFNRGVLPAGMAAVDLWDAVGGGPVLAKLAAKPPVLPSCCGSATPGPTCPKTPRSPAGSGAPSAIDLTILSLNHEPQKSVHTSRTSSQSWRRAQTSLRTG